MDQVDKLILQVSGQAELEKLNKQLKDEVQLLGEWIDQEKQAVNFSGQFSTSVRGQARIVRDLEVEISTLAKSTGGLVGGRGQGLLQLQYVLDDLTNTSGSWERKLSSISNNIPGLIFSLGGSAGIAGAIGIVSTAIIALAPVAKAAWDAMMGGAEGPEGVVKALDAAEEKLKKLQTEWAKLNAQMSPEEHTTKGLVEGVLGPSEGAASKLTGAVAGALTTSGRGEQLTVSEQEEIARHQKIIDRAAKTGQVAPISESRIEEIMGRLPKANFQRAAELVANAPTSRGARDTLRALQGLNPGAFEAAGFGNLSADLMESEPEALAAHESLIATDQANAGAAHQQRMDREKQAKQHAARRKQAERRDQARNREDVDALIQADRGEEQAARAAARDKDQAAKQAARDKVNADRERNKAIREAPHNQAMADVTAMSQMNNLGTPTAEQADKMADEMMGLMAEGLNRQAAAFTAVQRKLAHMLETQRRANDQFNAQMNMVGGGGPDMGMFSAMPEGPW